MTFVLKLYRNYSDELSRKTFFYSIRYLMYLFAVMLVDHYFWDWLVMWTGFGF